MATEGSELGLSPYLKRFDTEGSDVIIPLGITSFGRGPFLKCKEKKVSRNHGLLELTPDGQIFITSIHTTPVYVKPVGETEAKALTRNQQQLLNVGDEFRLLPSSFCYQLCIPEAPSSGKNGQDVSTSSRNVPELSISSSHRPEAPAPGESRPSGSGKGQLFANDSIDAPSASAGTTSMRMAESLPATVTTGGGGSSDASAEPASRDEVLTHAKETKVEERPSSTFMSESAAEPRTGGTRSERSPEPGREALLVPSSSSGNTRETMIGSRALPEKLSNGAAQPTPVVNGSVRKRKLPAFLLDLDSVAGSSSSDTPKKRGPAATAGGGRGSRGGRGGGGGGRGGGRGSQRTAPGARGSSRGRGRGRGRQRPSEREQLSQHSDDEMPLQPPSPPQPATATSMVTAAATPPASTTAGGTVTGSPAAGSPTKTSPSLSPARSAVATTPHQPTTTTGTSAATAQPTNPSSPRAPKMAAQGAGAGNHDLSDDSDDGAAAAGSSQREVCAYGSNCFRTNPDHRREFSHPEDADYVSPPTPAAGQPLPECEFGLNCYRRNPLHRKQFAHTSRPNPRREAKRKARQKAQKAAADGDTPDSYDLDDPFINDSDSDDYAPDESGSDWSADEGSGSDEDDRRRRDREARRLTGRH